MNAYSSIRNQGFATVLVAALAAVGTFAAAWLVTILMILKNPLRRRESLLAGFDTAAPPAETPAE